MSLKRISLGMKLFDVNKGESVYQGIIRDVEMPVSKLSSVLYQERRINKKLESYGLMLNMFPMTYPCTSGCLCYRCSF